MNALQMVPAFSGGKQSSAIARFGWLNNVLAVKFNSGKLYAYKGVPEVLFKELSGADSKGSFFSEFIRDGFPFQQVSLDDLAKLVGINIEELSQEGVIEKVKLAFTWLSIDQGDSFF